MQIKLLNFMIMMMATVGEAAETISVFDGIWEDSGVWNDTHIWADN